MRARAAATILLAFLAVSPALSQDRGQPPPGGWSMWEMMKRHDKDGDDRVTREEFGGKPEVFAKIDRDGDGTVTREEVETAARGRTRGGGRSGSSADVGWVFKRLDWDRNGRLDDGDLAEITKRSDLDRDGAVTEAEFNDFLLRNSGHMAFGRAPIVGSPAPDFRLTPLEGEGWITLSGILERKRPVVLVFGSFT